MALTLKQFIEEAYGAIKPGWKPSEDPEEYHEVSHQLAAHRSGEAKLHPSIHKALKHLEDPKNFFSAMKRSKVEVYNRQKLSRVRNTTGSDTWIKSRRELHPQKVARASTQAAGQKTGKNKLEMPIIIRAKNKKTGKTVEHSLAGNTRLSRHGDSGVPVHVIHFEH